MNVLPISRSSRKDGNTTILWNTILSELKSKGIKTELIQLFDKKVGASVGVGRRGELLKDLDTLNHEIVVVG